MATAVRPQGEAPDLGRSRLSEDSAFSYSCRRCSRCCVGKLIQVNPYEVARLARNLGIGAAEFRARYTDGARLNQEADGRCVFLGETGCTVHADRPLVCRLFPLGRIIDDEGAVRYVRPDFSPPPAGEFGEDGRVADYVTGQGAGPFIAAADAYFDWYCRARAADPDALDRHAPSEGDLLDLDRQVSAWCRKTGVEAPADIDERCRLHIRILDGLIDEEGEEDDEEDGGPA
jgi:Fe-S-cluster containining protein